MNGFHSIWLLSFDVYLKKRKDKRIHHDPRQNDRDGMVLGAVSLPSHFRYWVTREEG